MTFILPASISLSLLILEVIFYRWTFKSKRKNMWIGIAVFLLVYAAIVLSAAIADFQYQKELDSFDLNHDTLFSGNEITPRQQAAMDRLTNDTGRNFSVFTGAFVGGVLGVVAYLIAWSVEHYRKSLLKDKTS